MLQHLLQQGIDKGWLCHANFLQRNKSTHLPAAKAALTTSEVFNQKIQQIPELGVIEVLVNTIASGELYLLSKIIAKVSEQEDSIGIWVDAPTKLHAHGLKYLGIKVEKAVVVNTKSLKDKLWSVELAIKSGCCRYLVVWSEQLKPEQLRRLEILAANRGVLVIVVGYNLSHVQSHPVSLCYQLVLHQQRLFASVLKQKHGWPVEEFPVQDYCAVMAKYLALTAVKQKKVLPTNEPVSISALQSHSAFCSPHTSLKAFAKPLSTQQTLALVSHKGE